MVQELWRSSFPERHFRGGNVRLLQRSSEAGEDCSGEVLFPQRSAFSERILFISHVVCSDDIYLQKILLLRGIQG
jgi:hypothetical protein